MPNDGSPSWPVAGVLLFVASKALKYWAIRTLGERWTFRVLVQPGRPLVTTGPYRYVAHPNYIAVVGELVGAAMMLGARVSGPIMIVRVRRRAVGARAVRDADPAVDRAVHVSRARASGVIQKGTFGMQLRRSILCALLVAAMSLGLAPVAAQQDTLVRQVRTALGHANLAEARRLVDRRARRPRPPSTSPRPSSISSKARTIDARELLMPLAKANPLGDAALELGLLELRHGRRDEGRQILDQIASPQRQFAAQEDYYRLARAARGPRASTCWRTTATFASRSRHAPTF